ncbi:uncharacterized protein ACNS7B_014238 [Menidia menidia]
MNLHPRVQPKRRRRDRKMASGDGRGLDPRVEAYVDRWETSLLQAIRKAKLELLRENAPPKKAKIKKELDAMCAAVDFLNGSRSLSENSPRGKSTEGLRLTLQENQRQQQVQQEKLHAQQKIIGELKAQLDEHRDRRTQADAEIQSLRRQAEKSRVEAVVSLSLERSLKRDLEARLKEAIGGGEGAEPRHPRSEFREGHAQVRESSSQSQKPGKKKTEKKKKTSKEELQTEEKVVRCSCRMGELQDTVRKAAEELWQEQKSQLMSQQKEIQVLRRKVELLRSNFQESQCALLMTEQELAGGSRARYRRWVDGLVSVLFCHLPG